MNADAKANPAAPRRNSRLLRLRPQEISHGFNAHLLENPSAESLLIGE